MTDSKKPNPDHGSSLVWSTDKETARKAGVTTLLRKHGGNVDAALKEIFGDSCSYRSARDCSEVLAPHFGITPGEFMGKFKLWRKRKL